MGENDEKKMVINQIISTIDHLTKTIEYQVINLFTVSGYRTSRYYYTDFDETEKFGRVRELDFFALTNIESQIDGTHLKLMVKFIGDVKNHPHHNKQMFLLGLKPQKLGALNSLYFQEGVLKIEHERLVFPNCLDLYFFDEKGKIVQQKKERKNKKKRNFYDKFRAYCEQIVSGFITEVEKSRKQPFGLGDSKSSVMIPLLVFGNKVTFITGSPEEIKIVEVSVMKSYRKEEPKIQITPRCDKCVKTK